MEDSKMNHFKKREENDKSISKWEKLAEKHYEWKEARKVSIAAEIVYLAITAFISAVFRKIFTFLIEWFIGLF